MVELDSKKYLASKINNFDEATLLSPNINGNKENTKIDKCTFEILKSDELNNFLNDIIISTDDLILASTLLTLNKFNFTSENLIFLTNNVPFAGIFKNRNISIKDYLNFIHDEYITAKKFFKTDENDEVLKEYGIVPEFYYSFNNDLNFNNSPSNYLKVNETDKKISLILYYNEELYSAEYIETFLDSCNKIIGQFINNDLTKFRLCDVELVTQSEIPTFQPVENPFIHKRFEKQVESKGDDIALVSNGETLTYNELNQRANRVANSLIEIGAKPKSNILVMLPRDSKLISTILGIFKAGCSFIPIDLEYPIERIKYIYENSQADYIITNDGTSDENLSINELLKGENTSNPDVDVSPDDLAYMIYTSGSTGKPKGVMISHKNACNQVEGNPKCEYDNLLSIATIAFDTSLEDLLTGLTNGIKIIFANDEEIKNVVDLINLIKKNKPQVMEFTPSRLLSYLEVEEFCDVIDCAKCIVMGGEQFSAKAFNGVKQYCNAKIYNSYGPTEATIASNYKEITDSDNITVGPALRNYLTDVRDIDGKLLPKGIMGELYIGGVGVGKGYYNMDDKTKEVFLTINDIPYYRSGDYAIELPNGDIDIKGRIDNQIKLRGLRIEIGEIESNIARFPSIKQTAVVIKEINNTEHLCAYFTSEEKIDIPLLKRYLQNKLTKYMVPSVFMQLEEMPQTPNGKTDLKQLPIPELNLENIKPENETEEKIFKITSELLGTDEFGTTDDLYNLGFTSLTLMKLNSRIYNETDVNLDVISLFTNPTVKNLADKVDNNITNDIDINRIVDDAYDMEYFPLTSNQLGIYYECVQTDKIKYTLPYAIRFDNSINPYKLKEAIIKTIEIHPYLKTRIVNVEGQLKQKRCDDIAIDEIEIVEVDSISNKELMENEVKPIPIEDNQLFRFKIYKTPNETILFSDFHHIINDGASQNNFFEDVGKAYEDKEIESENVDGYIYSLIEEETAVNEVSEKYFKNKLTDGIESTVLTPNLTGNPEIGEIKILQDTIDSTFVRHFCQDHSISPNTLFMAATMICLNKFTFSDKSLITTIFNGRANPDFYKTQGMLVKTLPIVVKSEDRKMIIEDFIKVVDKAWKDALVHSNYPYTKLSEDYQLKPEFFYSFNEEMDHDIININGKSYDSIPLDGTATTDYKINLDFYDDGQNISVYLEYNNQLYTEDYVKEFLRAIKYVLIQFFVNDMDKLRIEDIELADSSDIPKFEPVENPFLHKRFEKMVETKGDETALISNGESLTYNELNQKANSIANALIKRGVKPKNNILIKLPRTSDLIASIWGILKAGCAFIPVDPEYPKERINYIFENSQAEYIISNETNDVSIDIKELLDEKNVENPDVEISPEDLAYMIYTSGSTGNPKGVMICHRNICNLIKDYPKTFYKKDLSMTTISFDVALEDILTSLTGGVKLIFANDVEIKNTNELVKLINQHQPEVIDLTPSRLSAYLESESFCEAIKCLKCIFLGGEQFSATTYLELRKYNKDAIVYNSYGPTETTITSNNKIVTDVNDLTVGPAIPNYITEVRDIDGKLVPDGVMGELYIGGPSVGKGYYNMPEKTKEAFLTINDIPYYRSGDYAIKLPNDDIDIKGRIDNQIKLRGLRIEIGEIESNINEFDGIKQSVVVIKKIGGNDHLCAYFTTNEEIDVDGLKKYLKDRLTEYMVPTVFTQLEIMPKTPNGKIDAKSLPKINIDDLKAEYVAPTTETEKIVVKAFEKVFNQEIGINDDFLVMGGDSLTAIKILSILTEEGISITVSTIMNNKTPSEIARIIDGGVAEYGFNLAKKGTINKNLFLIPPISGTSFIYLYLVENLEFEGNIYLIDDFKYDLPLEEMKKTDTKTVLDKYYDAIKDLFQDGDIIAGYSQGGIFTMLLASKLEQEKKVDKCILIDTVLNFKETNEVDREEVMGLIDMVQATDFDLEELSPEPFDIFTEKVVEVCRINSLWDFEPVTIDSPVIYLSTTPHEEELYNIANNPEFVVIDADHVSIVEKDVPKIVKYFK